MKQKIKYRRAIIVQVFVLALSIMFLATGFSYAAPERGYVCGVKPTIYI